MLRMLTIPDGVDLVEALSRELRGESGWVNAVGQLEAVELRAASEGFDSNRTLRGRFSLISMSGAAGGPYAVVLSRALDTGLETVGGFLVRGKAFGISAALQGISVEARVPAAVTETQSNAVVPIPVTAPAAASTPAVVRNVSPAVSRPMAPPVAVHAPTPAAPPVATAPSPAGASAAAPAVPGARWAAQAQAATSPASAASDDDEDEQFPEPGDLIQHFAFGLCEVLMSDGETLKIRDVKAVGRVREIRTDMLEVQGPTDSDGKRLFKMTRRT